MKKKKAFKIIRIVLIIIGIIILLLTLNHYWWYWRYDMQSKSFQDFYKYKPAFDAYASEIYKLYDELKKDENSDSFCRNPISGEKYLYISYGYFTNDFEISGFEVNHKKIDFEVKDEYKNLIKEAFKNLNYNDIHIRVYDNQIDFHPYGRAYCIYYSRYGFAPDTSFSLIDYNYPAHFLDRLSWHWYHAIDVNHDRYYTVV